MFIQYGLQLGPAKPKLTVLMPTLHLLDNTKMVPEYVWQSLHYRIPCQILWKGKKIIETDLYKVKSFRYVK